jgi:OmpA-OmpF porin, OOP family
VWPPLILILTALLVWYLGRSTGAHEGTAHGGEPEVLRVDRWAHLGAFFKRPLPTTIVLSIPERGMEAKLMAFIEDESKPVDKTTWFDFDRLLFETGSATLMPESQEQLKNVAEILKAYPKVEARVGGYTDNVGEPAFNLKLSQQRADNVTHELVSLGLAASRLTAEGYGEEHPVADNASEEGRALNRRISLRVTSK